MQPSSQIKALGLLDKKFCRRVSLPELDQENIMTASDLG